LGVVRAILQDRHSCRFLCSLNSEGAVVGFLAEHSQTNRTGKSAGPTPGATSRAKIGYHHTGNFPADFSHFAALDFEGVCA